MPANPFDTCQHCGRPRSRVVRSQKRAHAQRKQFGKNAYPYEIKCTPPRTRHQFSKDPA